MSSENITANFNFSITPENMREVFGFLHHQITQQSKEIGILNRRVSQLIQQMEEKNEDSQLSSFIKASNKRLDSFAASILTLSQQITTNSETHRSLIEGVLKKSDAKLKENIARVESRLDNLQQSTDNAMTFTNIFDLKIEDAIKEKLDEKLNEKFNEKLNDKPTENNEESLPVKQLEPPPSTSNSKRRNHSSLKKKKNTIQTNDISNCLIVDIQSTNNSASNLQKQVNLLQRQVSILKQSVESQQLNESQTRKEISQKLDCYATKAELSQYFEVFKEFYREYSKESSDNDQIEHEPRPSSKIQVPRHPGDNPCIIRQSSIRGAAFPHYTVISGDNLRRPRKSFTAKLSKPI